MSIALSAGAIGACLVVLWLLSLRLRDASIIDLFWGPGFAVIAWVTFFTTDGEPPHVLRRITIAMLTTIWALRLGIHLASRNIGKGEDPRYRAMRARGGPAWPMKSLFVVFGLQGVLMLIVSMPVQAALRSAHPGGWLDVLGAGVWFVGLSFETIGDWQLARFKRNPANRGQLITTGLWRYTRHPNYFGDFVVWWGLYLFALSAGAWWSLVGPLVMTWLLTRVSGVPLLEAAMKNRPGFAEYVRRTSSFFPLPPKKQ